MVDSCMGYDIDFYSNDHQMDLMITAELVDYGHYTKDQHFFDIFQDPDFKITRVSDSEDNLKDLSKEEIRRVIEVFCNIYWSEIKY